MDDESEPLLTLVQAAHMLDRPKATVVAWADRGDLPVAIRPLNRWNKWERLVRREDVLACAEKLDASPYRRFNRQPSESTAEEVDAMIAERMKHLPKWWWKEVPDSKTSRNNRPPELSALELRMIRSRRLKR